MRATVFNDFREKTDLSWREKESDIYYLDETLPAYYLVENSRGFRKAAIEKLALSGDARRSGGIERPKIPRLTESKS